MLLTTTTACLDFSFSRQPPTKNNFQVEFRAKRCAIYGEMHAAMTQSNLSISDKPLKLPSCFLAADDMQRSF